MKDGFSTHHRRTHSLSWGQNGACNRVTLRTRMAYSSHCRIQSRTEQALRFSVMISLSLRKQSLTTAVSSKARECSGNSKVFKPSQEEVHFLLLRYYLMDIDQSRSALPLNSRLVFNFIDELFRMTSSESSLSSGNAPEISTLFAPYA